MLLKLKRGKVKFFKKGEGWGFIIPKDGGKEVFFHVRHYSIPVEEFAGEPELQFLECGSARLSKPDDAVVYSEHNGEKGLMAVHWAFAEDWQEAMVAIAERPMPTDYRVRVIEYGHDGRRKATLWEGWKSEFDAKLEDGFPEMFNPLFIYVERHLITGWEADYHPRHWHPKYKDK